MSLETMGFEKYKEFETSMTSFMQKWKNCYYALLSNPDYTSKYNDDQLHEISWKLAEELHRATGQYLERNS